MFCPAAPVYSLQDMRTNEVVTPSDAVMTAFTSPRCRNAALCDDFLRRALRSTSGVDPYQQEKGLAWVLEK